MIKTLAVAKRIILQFRHDKRTLALMFVAPILVLWLLSVLLGANSYRPDIAVIDLPKDYVQELEKQDANIKAMTRSEAESLMKQDKLDAILSIKEGTTTLNVYYEGGNNSHNAAVTKVVGEATSDFSTKARARMEADIDAKKADIEDIKADAKAKQKEIKAKVNKAKKDAKKAQNKVKSAQKKAQSTQKKALKQLQGQVSKLTPQDQVIMGKAIKKFATTISSVKMPNISTSSINMNVDVDSLDLDSYDLDFEFDVAEYLPIQDTEKSYLHGNDEWEMFDFYGPIFIGLFIFVFTFLTSGMSLVNERSAGTMERFLATPIRPVQILGGYSIGFGLFAAVQVLVIVTIALKFIGFPNNGNVGLVIFVAVSMAIASVTFGLLVSGLARSAFQVIQLMLLFVVPQILLCGIFDLSSAPGWLQTLANYLPIKYGVDALQQIMLRGRGLEWIQTDILVLWGFIAVFFVLAALGLRKKRARSQS